MTLEKQSSIPDALDGDDFVGYEDVKQMQITVNRVFGRVDMVLAGELDSSTAPFLRQKLQDEVLPDPGDAVVLDIGLISFLGSTGLNLFLSLHKELLIQGSKLVIFSPTNMARRLFDITGLSEVLAIEP